MAIFRSKANNSSYSVQHTDSARAAICTEATRDLNAVFSGLYIADVVIEQKSVLEGANTSVLMENVFESAWKKIKEIFMKLKEKIIAWFKAVRDYLVALFTSGRKFVQKYGNEVKKRAKDLDLTKFEYEGYKNFDIDKAASLIDNLADKLKDVVDKFDAAKYFGKTGDKYDHPEEEVKKLRVDKTTNYSSIQDAKDKVREAALDDKKTLEYKEGISVDNMINFVTGFEKLINNTKDSEKKITKPLQDVIDATNKFEKNADAEPGAAARELVSVIKEYISYISAMVSEYKDCADTFMKQCVRILKRIYTYRPKKESVEINITGEGDLDENDLPEADAVTATIAEDVEINVEAEDDVENGMSEEDPATGDLDEENLLESCMKAF